MIIFQYWFLVKEITQIMSESNNVWGELLSTHEFIIYLNTSLYRWYPIGIAILGALTFNSSTKVKAWFLHFVWMSRVVSKYKKKTLGETQENVDSLTRHSPADQYW